MDILEPTKSLNHPMGPPLSEAREYEANTTRSVQEMILRVALQKLRQSSPTGIYPSKVSASEGSIQESTARLDRELVGSLSSSNGDENFRDESNATRDDLPQRAASHEEIDKASKAPHDRTPALSSTAPEKDSSSEHATVDPPTTTNKHDKVGGSKPRPTDPATGRTATAAGKRRTSISTQSRYLRQLASHNPSPKNSVYELLADDGCPRKRRRRSTNFFEPSSTDHTTDKDPKVPNGSSRRRRSKTTATPPTATTKKSKTIASQASSKQLEPQRKHRLSRKATRRLVTNALVRFRRPKEIFR